MFALCKMTTRRFVFTNCILAALFVNTLLFGGRLRMGEAFTAGLATGLGVGWLAFAVLGIIELRKPGRTIDERAKAIATRSAAMAFMVVVLLAAVMSALLRSETLALAWTAADACALVVNGSLVSFGVSFAALSRLM